MNRHTVNNKMRQVMNYPAVVAANELTVVDFAIFPHPALFEQKHLVCNSFTSFRRHCEPVIAYNHGCDWLA